MTRKTLVGTALAVLTVGAVLAGCSNNNTSSGGHDMTSMTNSPSSTPVSAASDHNQADVSFAQQMIPHHGQALEMAKLVPTRTSNAKVVDLAARIQKAQDPEIQQMTAWGTPPASTGMDMPGMSSGHSMP